MYINMGAIKRITANLPEELLHQATLVTQKNLTETLILGLQLIKRSSAYDKAQKLKGKINLKIDLDKSRERYNR